MTPFPLTEIYHYVLEEGWRIRELWRNDGEIRLCVYIYSQGMEDFIAKTGLEWEDAINQTKALQFSLYEEYEDG
jgi:hypothetical protein